MAGFYQPPGLSAQGAPGQAQASGGASVLYGAQAQDPHSQYLAAALAAMQKQQQGSATGLGENLLATALDRYGLQQRGQQLQAQDPNAPPVQSGGPVGGLVDRMIWGNGKDDF